MAHAQTVLGMNLAEAEEWAKTEGVRRKQRGKELWGHLLKKKRKPEHEEPSEEVREVWDLLMQGYGLTEIAAILSVSAEDVQKLARQGKKANERLDRETMYILAAARLDQLLPRLMAVAARGDRRAIKHVAEVESLQAELQTKIAASQR